MRERKHEHHCARCAREWNHEARGCSLARLAYCKLHRRVDRPMKQGDAGDDIRKRPPHIPPGRYQTSDRRQYVVGDTGSIRRAQPKPYRNNAERRRMKRERIAARRSA